MKNEKAEVWHERAREKGKRDAAGNHSYIIRHYRIDKTSPTMIYSDSFTGLNVSNNKWINKEAMYSNIYAYDELSGLSEKSKIHLYEVKAKWILIIRLL